jgi:hypothetical protein
MPQFAMVRRKRAAAAVVGGVALLALGQSSTIAGPASTEVQEAAVKNGELGFVVSDIKYVLGPDGDKTRCPNGMTSAPRSLFEGGQEQGARPAGAAGPAVAASTGAGASAAASQRARQQVSSQATAGAPVGAPGGGRMQRGSMCLNPLEAGPDPLFRTVGTSDVALEGLDLDGQISRVGGKPAAGTCAHDDFNGANGTRGIDNQFYRAVGCTPGFQSTGTKNGFATGMLTGSWGILIHLKGVDSLVNDNDVEVGIYANADPIQLSPKREAVSFASYATDPDTRFQGRTRGRIVKGVLTTDPVDVRFHHDVNNIHLERPIDAARLRLTFAKDGSIEGIMAGYSKVDDVYDYVVGMRSGKDAQGKPVAPQRIANSAAGSAVSAGMSCNGLYHALTQLADGQRDPASGACKAISIQYKIAARPAFVVGPAQRTNMAGR